VHGLVQRWPTPKEVAPYRDLPMKFSHPLAHD
jgi:hypothetical protein